MSKEALIILMSILSTPFLGALVSKYFERNKTKAETHNINIGGEISLGEGWQKYAIQQRQDKEELRKEFNVRMDEMRKEHADQVTLLKSELARVIEAKDERIRTLEGKVHELEKEVAKYKGI